MFFLFHVISISRVHSIHECTPLRRIENMGHMPAHRPCVLSASFLYMRRMLINRGLTFAHIWYPARTVLLARSCNGIVHHTFPSYTVLFCVSRCATSPSSTHHVNFRSTNNQSTGSSSTNKKNITTLQRVYVLLFTQCRPLQDFCVCP